MEKEKELKKLSSFYIYWLWKEFKFLNIVFKCCNYSTIYFGFIFSVNLIEAEKRWKRCDCGSKDLSLVGKGFVPEKGKNKFRCTSNINL